MPVCESARAPVSVRARAKFVCEMAGEEGWHIKANECNAMKRMKSYCTISFLSTPSRTGILQASNVLVLQTHKSRSQQNIHGPYVCGFA